MTISWGIPPSDVSPAGVFCYNGITVTYQHMPIKQASTAKTAKPISTTTIKSDYICLLGEIHFPVKIPASVADRYIVEAETPVTKTNVIYISDLHNDERTIILNQDGYNHPILRADLPSIHESLKRSKAKYTFEIIEPDREDGSDLAHYGHDAFLKISSFIGASSVRNQRYSKTMAYFRAVVS